MNGYYVKDYQSMGHVHAYSLAVHPSQNHSHLAMGLTGPALPISGGHVHQIMGYVSRENGHIHYYSYQTNLALQVEGAKDKHVHYFQGETSFDAGHNHKMESYTMPE